MCATNIETENLEGQPLVEYTLLFLLVLFDDQILLFNMSCHILSFGNCLVPLLLQIDLISSYFSDLFLEWFPVFA